MDDMLLIYKIAPHFDSPVLIFGDPGHNLFCGKIAVKGQKKQKTEAHKNHYETNS